MDDVDLAYAGAARQAELIRAGEVSSVELTELYVRRIRRLDTTLNAFRVVFEERALAEARQADGRRGAGGERPLLGVPIAIKDDVDVAGEVTAHGTNAFGAAATADAEVVRRLREAGAVLIGKTNVPELEIHPFTESPTWGATRNPWDLQRTPGGSSGGSAAAVAAGLVGAALGSDGGGSIRIPAGCCGLVGLKPQRDRVSTEPKINPWNGLSVWGALSRGVADSALFYDAVKQSGPSFVEAAGQEPGRLRIAYSFRLPPSIPASSPDDENRRAVLGMADRLRALGHEVFERDPDYSPTLMNSFTVRYLKGIQADAEAMPHPERLSRRTKGYAGAGRLVPRVALERGLASEEADRRRINRLFEAADVLMTPMFTRRAIPIGAWDGWGAMRTYVWGDARFVPYCGVFNHTAQPAMSVPAGFSGDDFPLAVQLVAPPDGEPRLLSLASQLERELGWPERRPAGFE